MALQTIFQKLSIWSHWNDLFLPVEVWVLKVEKESGPKYILDTNSEYQAALKGLILYYILFG